MASAQALKSFAPAIITDEAQKCVEALLIDRRFLGFCSLLFAICSLPFALALLFTFVSPDDAA